MGLITDKTSVILDYLGTPFLATQKTADGDEIDTLRCLGVIDHENHSCGYIGKIEEGSELNMVLISKEDIEPYVGTYESITADAVNSAMKAAGCELRDGRCTAMFQAYLFSELSEQISQR